MIKRLIVILCMIFTSINMQSQDTVCFTNEEVLNTYNHIRELEIKDSLQKILISELKTQISNYELLVKQDSILLSYKDLEIQLLKDRINVYKDYVATVKPKWYDRKIVWFLAGAGTIILSSYVVANTIR